MYHGTTKNDPSSMHSIRADRFSEHLRYLKEQGWHTALFRELSNVSELPKKTVVLTFDDGYADNYEGAFLPLVENNMKATWFITTDYIGKYSHMMGLPSPQTQMLNAEQLIQMDKGGMEIGSHTCSHPDLASLSYQQQRNEMIKSKQVLESIIQREICTFSYPYGRHNADSIEAVKDAGYKLACIVNPNEFGNKKNLFMHKRVPILANDSISTLARKLVFPQWYYLPPRKKMIKNFYKHIKLIGHL
jgi:peptidoglycan/xylan/chitin deacetylase (PgdA/CDA1 family)